MRPLSRAQKNLIILYFFKKIIYLFFSKENKCYKRSFFNIILIGKYQLSNQNAHFNTISRIIWLTFLRVPTKF